MSRRRHVAVTLVLSAVLSLAASGSSAFAAVARQVSPGATCSRPLPGGTWVAVFGYSSTRRRTVSIPIGQRNYVSPSTVSGQPITQFAPGSTGSAFQLTVPANVQSVTWVLQQNGTPLSATLTKPTGSTTTGTCSSNQIPVFGGTVISTSVAAATAALVYAAARRKRRAVHSDDADADGASDVLDHESDADTRRELADSPTAR